MVKKSSLIRYFENKSISLHHIPTTHIGMKQDIADSNFQKAKIEFSDSDFVDNDVIFADKLTGSLMALQPRRMTFILVALCTKGEIDYTVDTQPRHASANDIIIITDRHIIDNIRFSDDLDGLCMMVSVNFFYDIIHNINHLSTLLLFANNHPVVGLSEKECDIFNSYFYLLKAKAADTDNHYRRDVVRTLMLAMLYDLSNVITRTSSGQSERNISGSSLFTRFLHLVETHFRNERRVGWYARQLCITPKHLSETIKSVSKRTPNEWIDSYVTLEMRILLKNSSKSIKEITQLLHFPNQSFMGKYFKEHVGMSPSQFRKS